MKLIALIGSKVRIHLPIENKQYVADNGPIVLTFDGGAVILTANKEQTLLDAFGPGEWKRAEILK